jgi:RAD51-like protein 2
MAKRSRILNTIMQMLCKIAQSHSLAVVVVNQVTQKTKDGVTSLVPSLGDSFGHASTNRMLLSWKSGLRWAKLLKSPYLAGRKSVAYQVLGAGIRDVEESREESKEGGLKRARVE